MVAIWKGSGTPTGDGTVTANLSTGGTMEAAVILVSRYSGVNLSDPIGNYSSANENGVDGACSESIPDTDSPSVTINTTSGNLVYSAVQMRNRTIAWTDLTSRGYVTTGPVGSVVGVDAADLTADASSETAAGTLSAAQDWSIIAVEIKQASGTDNWWAGQLDNVSIYNYARSSAQIAWDYNRGKPVGWWKFDECAGATANDSSGNGNNGTIYPVSVGNTAVGTCSSGTSTEMWNDGTTGKRNASLGFDGSDDYVSLASPTILDDLPAMTLAAWIYPTTTSGSQRIMDKSATNSPTSGWVFIKSATNSVSLILDYTSDVQRISNDNVVTLNQWNHVVATWDGSASGTGIHLYVNGGETGYQTTAGSGSRVSDASQNLLIGNSTEGNRLFNGQIDDVKIFNYALTAQQVKTVYNEGAVRFAPLTGSP